IYYLNGLTDSEVVVEIIKKLVEINDYESHRQKLAEIIKNRLVHEQVSEIHSLDEAIDQILSGLIVLFIYGEIRAFVVDVRLYPVIGRDELNNVRVNRGSRVCYPEYCIVNTALPLMIIFDHRIDHEVLRGIERAEPPL